MGCSPAAVHVKCGSSPCSCLSHDTALGSNLLIPWLEGRPSCISCLSRLAAFKAAHGNLLALSLGIWLKSAKTSRAGTDAPADAASHVPASLF